MSLLDILTSWLEDNINMESDLFFDNDVDNTTSESLYPAVEKAALLQIVGGDKLIIPFC
ncbi:hypothetical protein ACNHKP_25370 (plasmid) [Escherichia coli]|uniref:hypothetical protein n=1 Tax=Escherichia coli TaxID=562 RepID=UPI00370CB55C